MAKKEHDIPLLLEALEDRDFSVRFNAGLDLVKAGRAEGVPPLIEAFNHESSVTRIFHASRSLAEFGEAAIPALLAALDSGALRQRVVAAATLIRIRADYLEQAFPALMQGLRADDEEAATDALRFLGDVGKAAQQAIPHLLEALRMPYEQEDPKAWGDNRRVLVAALLAHLGEPRQVIVEALIQNLCDPADAVRWGAAVALGEIGAAAGAAIPRLRKILLDESEVETIRVEAAYALSVIASPKAVSLPVLLQALASPDDWVRIFTARILGEMGARGRRARLPADANWRMKAFLAYRKVRRVREPAAIVEALIVLLDDPIYDVRRNAAWAIARIGERAPLACEALMRGLERLDTGPVFAETLAQLGDLGLKALKKAGQSDQPFARRHAAYALSRLGDPDGQADALALDPDKFYIHFNPKLDAEKKTAFESLFRRSVGGTVDYDLPYPKVEFLRYLVEERGLFMHGSRRADLEVLKPVRYSIDGADSGNVSGVYADLGYIRPIYFAVVDRQRSFGLSNGFFDTDEQGNPLYPEERGFDHRYYKLAIGVNGIHRDPWCEGTVYALPPDSFEFWNEWTSRTPVRPILRIAVNRKDLPIEVWGVDYRQIGNNFVQMTETWPFLHDTQYTPIRPGGKPPWLSVTNQDGPAKPD